MSRICSGLVPSSAAITLIGRLSFKSESRAYRIAYQRYSASLFALPPGRLGGCIFGSGIPAATFPSWAAPRVMNYDATTQTWITVSGPTEET